MNVTIDYDKLAIGLLDTFTEGDKAAMAFGMIPLAPFNAFLKLVYEEIHKKGGTALTEGDKEHVEKELSMALYRNAEMVV
ncbi:MAG: hypothetical protein DRO67_00140 [Candidatus Asgardarchaeum californiense]|nr:MAG: hypothetical protein DRO67_00140 [Candidatus Asgardarchaeum californiense]